MKKLAFIMTTQVMDYQPLQVLNICKTLDLDIIIKFGKNIYRNYLTGEFSDDSVFKNYNAICTSDPWLWENHFPLMLHLKSLTAKDSLIIYPHSSMGSSFDISCATQKKFKDIKGVMGLLPKDWVKFSSMKKNDHEAVASGRVILTNYTLMLENAFEEPPTKPTSEDTVAFISYDGPYDYVGDEITYAKFHPMTEAYKIRRFIENNPKIKLLPKNYEIKYRVCNHFKNFIIGHSSMMVELSLRAVRFGLSDYQRLALTKDSYAMAKYLNFNWHFDGPHFIRNVIGFHSDFSEVKRVASYYPHFQEATSEKVIAEFAQNLHDLNLD